MPSLSPDENPLTAPSVPADLPTATRVEGHSRLHLGWAAVFAANLVIPVIFGWAVVADHDGFIGMLFATTLLWLLTHGIFDRHRSLRGPLLTGGVCVAISQFYPALQFVAGAVSVTVASRLIPITDHGGRALQKLSMPGAILATMLTGGSLLMVAVVLGMVVRRIRRALGWVGAEPPKDIKHYREIIS